MGEVATGSGLLACAAIIIAPNASCSNELLSLAGRVGFGAAVDHDRTVGLDPDLQPYFVMHYAISDTAKASLLCSIRQSSVTKVQYAPIVVIMPDGPFEQTIHYIKMGFDDVISLPEKPRILSTRLAGQVWQDRLYIETEDYLGPDRRRMDLMPHESQNRRQGGSKHARITFVREPGAGIRILNRQLVLRPPMEVGPVEVLNSRDGLV
ncbi:hypothetical protein ABIE28_000224 [Devosia sp. 2618]